jgi:hypothetical protein
MNKALLSFMGNLQLLRVFLLSVVPPIELASPAHWVVVSITPNQRITIFTTALDYRCRRLLAITHAAGWERIHVAAFGPRGPPQSDKTRTGADSYLG